MGIRHGSDPTGLSPNIWSDCPVEDFSVGAGGFFVMNDFTAFPTAGVITTEAPVGSYNAYAGAGGNVSAVGEVGGALLMAVPATDNASCAIAQASLPFRISGITGAKTGKFWFEAKIKLSTVADVQNEMFVGLCDLATLAAAVPITAAAGVLANQNLVGFYRVETDGDAINIVYKADGVAQVTVKVGAAVPAANTYLRLGIKFDPSANVLTFFVNGVALPDTVGGSVLGAAAGTVFPNDVQLGFIAAIRAAAAVASNQSVDWFACAQAR